VHEYSLVVALMERVEAEAVARRAIAVHRVCVRIGELSGVEPDLLESAFAIVQAGTICERAMLDVERVPARWACSGCHRPLGAGERLQCPACGAPAALAGGDELLLGEIDLEVP
jgi:hydrogenase nickel incorporation protein HypA/HybF